MDNSTRNAAIAAACIMLGFGLVAYFMPTIMLAGAAPGGLRHIPSLTPRSASFRSGRSSQPAGSVNANHDPVTVLAAATGAATTAGAATTTACGGAGFGSAAHPTRTIQPSPRSRIVAAGY